MVVFIANENISSVSRYGVIIGQDVNSQWGVSAGLPGRSDGEVYITCLKHALMSLLRSSPHPAITTSVGIPAIL